MKIEGKGLRKEEAVVMKNTSNKGLFTAFQLGDPDRSPFDIRQYWTPERKKAAVPARMFRTGTDDRSKAGGPEPDAVYHWGKIVFHFG